jgi:hypothetical protein
MCTVEGCNSTKRHVNGVCFMHYQRFRKYGDYEGRGIPKGEALAFLVNHLDHDGDECLIWPYSRRPNGYAQITYQRQPMNAHRLMCRMAHGEPSSPKLQARHLCGNGTGGCVNPKHLAWGTAKQNEWDKLEHGTTNRGERQGQHRLTEKGVLEIYAMQRGGSAAVGAKYGVSEATIRAIWSGRNWSWLTGAAPRQGGAYDLAKALDG